MVDAVRASLECPADMLVSVSYSGGMFKLTELVLEPFVAALRASSHPYRCVPPELAPAAGAALYAAKTFGSPLTESALTALKSACAARAI
jgi:hypothetical protein